MTSQYKKGRVSPLVYNIRVYSCMLPPPPNKSRLVVNVHTAAEEPVSARQVSCGQPSKSMNNANIWRGRLIKLVFYRLTYSF